MLLFSKYKKLIIVNRALKHLTTTKIQLYYTITIKTLQLEPMMPRFQFKKKFNWESVVLFSSLSIASYINSLNTKKKMKATQKVKRTQKYEGAIKRK